MFYSSPGSTVQLLFLVERETEIYEYPPKGSFSSRKKIQVQLKPEPSGRIKLPTARSGFPEIFQIKLNFSSARWEAKSVGTIVRYI